MGQDNNPIFSSFADDPEMFELIGLFIVELPDRVETIRQAVQQGENDALKRIAHQLRGAAPSYGFSAIGEAAGRIESTLQKGVGLDQLPDAVDELIALCERATDARAA